MHILNTNIGNYQNMYQEKVLLSFVKLDNDSITDKKQEKTNKNISSFIKLWNNYTIRNLFMCNIYKSVRIWPS